MIAIHRDMPFADYRALKGKNYSSISKVEESPLAYRYNLDNPRKDTAALSFGRIVHMAVLEPDLFMEETAVWRGKGDRRTKAYKEWAANQTGTIITEQEERDALDIRKAVYENDAAFELLTYGEPEVSCEVDDIDDDGALRRLKCRWDYIRIRGKSHIVDLKTTRHSLHKFDRTVRGYNYHAQAAFYQHCAQLALNKDMPVYFIAVTKMRPFDVGVFRVPDAALEEGRRMFAAWLDIIDECEATGRWPGAMPGMNELDWIDTSPVELDIDGERVAL